MSHEGEKTAEPTEMPCGGSGQTHVGPGNHVLDAVAPPEGGRGKLPPMGGRPKIIYHRQLIC